MQRIRTKRGVVMGAIPKPALKHFLVKPFEPDNVIKIIKAILS